MKRDIKLDAYKVVRFEGDIIARVEETIDDLNYIIHFIHKTIGGNYVYELFSVNFSNESHHNNPSYNITVYESPGSLMIWLVNESLGCLPLKDLLTQAIENDDELCLASERLIEYIE